MRRLILLALLAASCLPLAQARRFHGGILTGGGATLLFNIPNAGFVGSNAHAAWSATIPTSGTYNGYLLLTPASVHQAGCGYYTTNTSPSPGGTPVVDISGGFTTDFAFVLGNSGGNGITFSVQNSTSTTNPDGSYGILACGDANGMGYGQQANQDPGYAPGNSIALKFDASSQNGCCYIGSVPSTTGLYTDGEPDINFGMVPENSLGTLGINIGSGDTLSAHVVYDTQVLSMVLTDTSTGKSTYLSWPINIAAITGSTTDFVGFTGGAAVDTMAAQYIKSWDWYTGYNTRLSSPTFNVASGQYASAQTVTISGPAGATIYYTTDGTPPTEASTLYSGPLTVSASEYVRAIASESNFTDSVPGGANYQICSGCTYPASFPSGFSGSSNLIALTGMPYSSGSGIVMTDETQSMEQGAAWYIPQVGVNSFSTTFTFEVPAVQNPGAVQAGLMFVLQNQPPASLGASAPAIAGGPYTLGGGPYPYSTSVAANCMAYCGILESIGVKFDLSNNSTGLYVGGDSPVGTGTALTGINLSSGHVISVTLTYSGTTMNWSVEDMTTTTTDTGSFTGLNIASDVGGSNAWAGFTASSLYNSNEAAEIELQSWTMN